MKDYKSMEDIAIFSTRLAEIFITECGIKPLKKVKYIESVNEKTDEKKVKKLYIFKNTPEIFQCVEKYMFSKEVNN